MDFQLLTKNKRQLMQTVKTVTDAVQVGRQPPPGRLRPLPLPLSLSPSHLRTGFKRNDWPIFHLDGFRR